MGTYGDHIRSSSITKHHGLVFDVMLDDIYILMMYDSDLNMKSNKLKYRILFRNLDLTSQNECKVALECRF